MTENEKIFEHFLNPRNVGTIEKADGYCRGINPITGYITEIYLKIEEEKIVDIKFKTNGCVTTIASTSAISTIVKGRRLSDIIKSEKSFEELAKLLTDEIGEIPLTLQAKFLQPESCRKPHFSLTPLLLNCRLVLLAPAA